MSRRPTTLCLRTILAPLGAGIALSILSSCFTGVESTPKIDASELKRAKVARPTPEDAFLNAVVSARTSEWTPGRKLIVADAKIRLVLTTADGGALPDLTPGAVLTFRRFEPATALLGNEAADAVFAADGYPELRYRIASSPAELTGENAPVVDVPFTVDPLLAERADSIVAERSGTMYILSPLWYDAATEKDVGGYRLVSVRVDSVRPGNHIFPLKVYFHVADANLAKTDVGRGEKMVLMAHGGKAGVNTRTFASLFAFDEPRKRYPHISDDVWALIVNSKVTEGMTKEECRLALGSPSSVELTPTRTGDIERWGYSDGIYLMFNPEGILMRYRL